MPEDTVDYAVEKAKHRRNVKTLQLARNFLQEALKTNEVVRINCECGDKACYGLVTLPYKKFSMPKSKYDGRLYILHGHDQPFDYRILSKTKDYLTICSD